MRIELKRKTIEMSILKSYALGRYMHACVIINEIVFPKVHNIIDLDELLDGGFRKI